MVPHPTTGVDLFSSMTLDFDTLVARANRKPSSISQNG